MNIFTVRNLCADLCELVSKDFVISLIEKNSIKPEKIEIIRK